MALAHTPYDGSATPFTIGLKPLDLRDWLEIDALYPAYLDEKDRLIAERPGDVFAAEAGTDEAQREVFDLVAAHIARHGQSLFQTPRDHDAACARMADFDRVEDAGEPPLQMAARLVQDDLVLMRKGDDGWRLAAASLCFPSSWTLAEKFGRPLGLIHAPVPGFGEGTRNATVIERIFDKLKVEQPVVRMNWSLQNNPALHHPLSGLQRDERAAARPPRFAGIDPIAATFIRVERQTLRRLPGSGDILFTIRIHLDAMERLRAQPDRARLATSLADQLCALDDAQLDYKGVSADRDRLSEALRAVARA